MDRWRIPLLLSTALLALVGWLSSAFALIPEASVRLITASSAVLGSFLIAHGALSSLKQGVFGVDLLAAVSLTASILLGEYLSASVITLMLGGGELLEDYAFRRASRAIQMLVEASPRRAVILREGEEVEVDIEEVKPGDRVVVRPGERVPVDGLVLRGRALVNQAPITGESIPLEKTEGDELYSGSIVELGFLEIRATAIGEESTYGRIIALVREAEEHRAPIERAADRYARYMTPLILAVGAATYLVTGDPRRMASVFLIACPCALTLATPTAIIASLGNSARRGILIRNGESLERLVEVDILALDKTGTITKGTPEVINVMGFRGTSESEVLRLAASAERRSEHPIARAILIEAEKLEVDPLELGELEVYPGLGVRVEREGSSIVVGNVGLMRKFSIPLGEKEKEYLTENEGRGTVVFVAEGGRIIGGICLSDVPRESVEEVLRELRYCGVERSIMLTGDNPLIAEEIGRAIGVDLVVSNLLPSEKADYIKRLRGEGHIIAMVGDGINDAPALAAADVGIAMGLTGTDIAIETAGIVLARDALRLLPKLMRISRRTMGVIKQNIFTSMIVNLLGVALSTLGLIHPLLASVIHEVNALFVMLNSLRLLQIN